MLMKSCLYRYLLAFLLVTIIPFISFSQDITGIWKGYFVSDGGEHYKLEFQVSQKAAYGVTGVSYSYLDVRFYGKATMTGTFVQEADSFKIREIKTVEVKSTLGGATCIMNYRFKYVREGKEEFLEGTYLGKYEAPYQLNPPGKWGDCGGGKVFLRKVTTSDFYVEPFLRNKLNKDVPIIDNEPPRRKDSVKTNPVITKVPVKKPVTTNPAIKKPVTTITKPPVKKPVTITTKPIVVKKDTATKINTPVVKKPVTDTTQKKPTDILKIHPLLVKTPEVLRTRSNELMKAITVSDPDVTVKLFDNGEIDGDTISVYLDKKLVLSSKRLTASPLVVKFRLDEDDSDHELTMVAENLGRIPPNTSLMVVESGKQRIEVRITSTEQKNAVVRFRYQKPK